MDKRDAILQSSPWQKISFLQGFPQSLAQDLMQGAQIVDTKPRGVIFTQDETATDFGFVLEGVFRLFRTNGSEHRVIMDFVEAGGMIGGLLMAHPHSVYPVTVQSVGVGQFLKIPRATFHQHWLSDPEVMKRTQMAQLERMQGVQKIREWQKLNLEEKIASLFERWKGESNIVVQMTRADVADTVGASTEAVIRVISDWESRGLVKKLAPGKIEVTAANLLAEVQNVSRQIE